jgi:hypothetical protein
VLETCRGIKKLILKQKFCSSGWLITEINMPRCTVSKTSKSSTIVSVSENTTPDVVLKQFDFLMIGTEFLEILETCRG